MVKKRLQNVLIGMSSLFLLNSCTSSFSESFPYELAPKDSYFSKPAYINVLSSTGLKLTSPNGNRVTEVSGISWDADEQVLYGVGDEGVLYHLKITEKNNTITGVKVLAEFPFLDKKHRPLKKKWRDSEGISSLRHDNGIIGDTELIVSFEGKPRIVRYTPQGGYIAEVKLPEKLWRKKNYRHKNNALESVVVHPTEGIITAAEFPLKAKPITTHTLYAASGKEWNFPASKAKNSAVTGLEVLPNGNILVLERAWAGIKNPIVVSLSEVMIGQCSEQEAGYCKIKKLASLSTSEGWLLDNFEGLAHYKGNKYIMISDDNHNRFQTTILVLLEIKNAVKTAKNF